MTTLKQYFPFLSEIQIEKLSSLHAIYQEWNAKVNVISRKDMGNFYIHHLIHSLSISKVIMFKTGAKVMDIGTGGGLPGIPLAIMFPETKFYLVDSTAKKIKVVEGIVEELALENVVPIWSRVEDINQSFDFITGRAVKELGMVYRWSKGKISKNNKHTIPNGIIYLKGGDFEEELKAVPLKNKQYQLKEYFEEDYFNTKKVVHLYNNLVK